VFPQVVRVRITGHRTDSMERRYKIVDVEDIRIAKELMERKPGGIGVHIVECNVEATSKIKI
jgi:hypothetical protein